MLLIKQQGVSKTDWYSSHMPIYVISFTNSMINVIVKHILPTVLCESTTYMWSNIDKNLPVNLWCSFR